MYRCWMFETSPDIRDFTKVDRVDSVDTFFQVERKKNIFHFFANLKKKSKIEKILGWSPENYPLSTSGV